MLALYDVRRNKSGTTETSQKAVAPAAGAKSELDSRLLNALRRQRFGSAGSLAAFTKQPAPEVAEALNDLIARGLVRWQDESLGSAGAGFIAVEDPSKAAPNKSNDKPSSGLPAWVNALDPL